MTHLRPAGYGGRGAFLALAIALCGLSLASAQGTAPRTSPPPVRPAPNPESIEIKVVPVQKNVYMLASTAGNVAVQIGDDGVLLVDAGTAPMAQKLFAAIRTLTNKPIHTIVNTHLHSDHTGGNLALVKLGAGGPQAPRVMGHENTYNRMMDAAVAANANLPASALPMNAYFTPTRDFFLNGEAIVLHHVSAHTDGDTLVHFRGSDVVSAGDVFNPDLYPVIDIENGGTVSGVIAGLNRLLEITVPAKYQEGGTYVVPGHGRICDEAEVVEYRDMVTIIRDRVADLAKKGLTLEQVKAAKPSRDYDGDYGSSTGFWTTDMFVEAVYRTINAKN
jgi:glyoxylase-like metal-dependent hydrolase (beta-lactamase superfamily II)